MTKTKIYIYGTLKKGNYFHDHYLTGPSTTFIGPAVTSKDYTLYIHGLPMLIKEESDKGVKGEVYEVDADTIADLDVLEGHPNLYNRDIIEVKIGEDDFYTKVWAYLYPKHLKPSSAWKEYEFT